ncbi:AcrR family transcriptional regulator [Sphingomonas zeicaulis]|uniref:TetR/AcrR family transcriptional regulator n=1 Tax=Sphingomonas zeicaulis TaxID=1632740 RepID=UPI003D21EC45
MVKDGDTAVMHRREDRRNAILDAAEDLFLDQGFDRVSLAAIVKRSGGSLATVYEMFGNKQGLLRAMVLRLVDRDLETSWSSERDAVAPSIQLRELAYRIRGHMCQPKVVALNRIVIMESLRDPAFGRAFHDQVYGARGEELIECFWQWTQQGRANFDDPVAAVDLYISIVIGDSQEALLGVLPEVDRAAIDWRLAPFLSYFKVV